MSSLLFENLFQGRQNRFPAAPKRRHVYRELDSVHDGIQIHSALANTSHWWKVGVSCSNQSAGHHLVEG